jgi:uncharacterized membrane protein
VRRGGAAGQRPRRALRRVRKRVPLAGDLTRTFAGLAVRAAAGAAGGSALALLTLLVDDAIGWSLPLDAPVVRDLLVTLTGASLTIAVFALWMRSIVVGLVAGPFAARTVTGYLDDGFQRATAGWMVAAVSVLVTVTLGAPPVDDQVVPPLATVLALTTVTAALLGILVVVRQAAERLDTSDVVHQLAEEAFRVLEQTSDLANEDAPESPHDPVRSIESRALGWVVGVDRRELLARLPAGAHAQLEVGPGAFVAPGQVLLTVDHALDETTADQLRRAVDVGRRRFAGSDLDTILGELTDVARRAAVQDAGTAEEALRYLEAVLLRLLGRRLPTGNVRDGDRVVTDRHQPTVADHVRRTARQLRLAAAGDPHVEALAEEVLERVATRADGLGDAASADAARHAASAPRRHPHALADHEDGGP